MEKKPTDRRFIDLEGRVFGSWVVMGYAGRTSNRKSLWECLCECGTVRVIVGPNLTGGLSTCCGCLGNARTVERSWRHGGCSHEPFKRLYHIYRHMLDRCDNPSNASYHCYGGRGIKVCRSWRENFSAFREWAERNEYAPPLTIERKDVDGDYSPGNCTWIPRETQAINKQQTLKITAFGTTQACGLWAKDPRCKVEGHTLWHRIKSGWDGESAITTPAKPQRKLSPAEASEVKAWLANGGSVLSATIKFGISKSAGYAIRKGKMWGHI